MYEELYAQNRGLLITLANRWREACERDRAVSVEDLAQAGFFGLVKAAQTFDEAAGKSWSSWAAWYIQREFENALYLRDGKFTRPHTFAAALDAPLSEDSAEGLTLGDMLADENAPDIDAGVILDELRQTVRESVEQIREDGPRRAVQLCDLGGRTNRQTAEVLGVTEGQACALRRKAHGILRNNPRIMALASDFALDDMTRFYAHKGLAAFERDRTSVTEGAALWRIEQRDKRQA